MTVSHDNDLLKEIIKHISIILYFIKTDTVTICVNQMFKAGHTNLLA